MNARRAPPRAALSRPLTLAALALLVAAAAILVWHRALAGYFSQDDFLSLARVTGLAPRLTAPWRILGNQLFWDALYAVARFHPTPYHAAALLSHLGGATLLLLLLARRVSGAAAAAGAVFFAVHPALFTALYWVSASSDSFALLFALGALVVAEARGRARWLALPLFAGSLLFKESTILLPLALLVLPPRRDAPGTTPGRREAPGAAPAAARALSSPRAVAIGLGVVAGAYGLYFALSAYPTYFVPASQAAAGTAGAAPYALNLGKGVIANALSLTGWAVNFLLPTVTGFGDAADPTVYPWAIGAVLLWLAGLAVPALRRSGWLAGGALYTLFVIPVLPLGNHTYHYYLYAPLVGVAWCLAALVEALPARPLFALVLAALLTWNGEALVRKIETMPFLIPDLRAEPTVDRGRIARRVAQDLGDAALPRGARLAFWSPTSIAIERTADGDSAVRARETYFERNVRSALLDGLAVRVLYPQVDSVVFVREYRSRPEPWRYAVYLVDGTLHIGTSAELDSVVPRLTGGH
jgi:hypothetical protein